MLLNIRVIGHENVFLPLEPSQSITKFWDEWNERMMIVNLGNQDLTPKQIATLETAPAVAYYFTEEKNENGSR